MNSTSGNWLKSTGPGLLGRWMKRIVRLAQHFMAGPVCVTGGSGFLGSWCIKLLLEDGYRVHTTTRSEP